MRSFDMTWDEEIAEITASPESQTATVEFRDPSRVTETYDIETGQWTVTGNSLIASTRARVVPVRSPAYREASETLNATSITYIRIQVPRGLALDGRIKKGVQAFVTDCDRNPELLTRAFTFVSGIEGSVSASRTFLFSTDEDVVVDD